MNASELILLLGHGRCGRPGIDLFHKIILWNPFNDWKDTAGCGCLSAPRHRRRRLQELRRGQANRIYLLFSLSHSRWISSGDLFSSSSKDDGVDALSLFRWRLESECGSGRFLLRLMKRESADREISTFCSSSQLWIIFRVDRCLNHFSRIVFWYGMRRL